MNAAAETYVAWLNTTASEARQTANQARSSAAAFEAAYTATVPPPVIATNRTVLAALVATNILGQNTPAIAATEAQYSAMWAQDAVAMYTYAAASATATALTPFTSAPQNTNPAGQAAQQASTDQATANTAHTLLSNIPHVLQTMAQGGTPTPAVTSLQGILGSTGFQDVNMLAGDSGSVGLVVASSAYLAGGILAQLFPLMSLALPATAAAGAVSDVSGAPAAGLGNLVGSSSPAAGALGSAGAGQGAITAGLGDSGLVGKLSVPPSWSTATPQIRLASTALPIAGLDATPAATATPPTLFGGIPPMASVVNAPRGNSTYSQGLRSNLLGQDAGRPGYRERTRDHQPQPQQGVAPNDESATSAFESDLVARLRKEIAEVALERDAAARLIMEAIR
ncbi:PPE family protein [Mycobacterium simiae]|nr:PPE family protein [Mycobacterium simiae]